MGATSGCAPARMLSSRLALIGPSRKRTSGDGLALEIRPLQPAQPMRSAQTTARGRRMPGTRGAMPGDASESSRQQRVPYRKLRGGYWALHSGWRRGPFTNASSGCTLILSRRIKRHDLYRIVPASAAIAGRGRMVRRHSDVDIGTGP